MKFSISNCFTPRMLTILLPLLAAAPLSADDVIPGTPRSENVKTSEGYAPSNVQASLNIEVDNNTDEIRFIRDNNDPFVITKAYELKNANPYAVRGYLLGAVRARKVSSSPVEVTSIKFNSGRGLLLVSAEEYRFKDSVNGDGIDTLIKKLDRTDLCYNGSAPMLVYFPKHAPAANLCDMLTKIGSSSLDPQFTNSPETFLVDGQLNALLICAPEWSWKHLAKMLDQYDRPIPEVKIRYRLLEIYAENDDKLGLDFQSWKNNDGVDFFAAGIKTRRNWSTFFTGNVSPTGFNSTEYVNFNPKWNTRYLDFLTSIGKAEVVTSGVLTARHNQKAEMRIDSGFFYERSDAPYTAVDPEFYYTAPNPDVIPRQPISKILPEEILLELLPNLTRSGYDWRMLGNLAGVIKYDTAVGEAINKQLAVISSATATMQEKQAAYVALQGLLQEEGLTELLNYSYYNRNPITNSTTDQNYDVLTNSAPGVIHGKIQYPMAEEGFSFYLAATPVVTGASATMEINMASTSLLGWNSDGSMRASDSAFDTKIQIGYEAKEFVIGGIKKTDAVRGVAGLPILKDIPVLGLLFSTETESIKQSQLVLIAEVECNSPALSENAEVMERLDEVIKGVNKGVESPIGNVFFQHYYIDSDVIE